MTLHFIDHTTSKPWSFYINQIVKIFYTKKVNIPRGNPQMSWQHPIGIMTTSFFFFVFEKKQQKTKSVIHSPTANLHRAKRTTMAARKRAVSSAVASSESTQRKQPQEHPDPPIAPPKWGLLLKLSIFSIPYFYLIFYHYSIDPQLRRSILINAGMSLAGFFVTVRMIPVASRYVLKRNLFGYDINKKGTSQGNVKV